MSSIIVIKNLRKYFGKLKAVDDINLEVEKGQIFGFLGPNGAGKSTTIRCLMGFNKPTSGQITVLGHDMITNAVEAKRKIGYLPGNVQLYDNWTGRDHIRFFESVRGKSKNIDSLIQRFNYNPDIKFRHLSSGNKQKLGLILALMYDPKLLVMDEPTTGLDPLLQNEIYKILLEMRARGATIFVSSHNLAEVDKLCDRIAIIKEGKLVAVENIKSLRQKSLHKVDVRFGDKFQVADFRIDGVSQIDEIAGGLSITVGGGDLNPILQALAGHKILDLEIGRASLEDVFMKYYERDK